MSCASNASQAFSFKQTFHARLTRKIIGDGRIASMANSSCLTRSSHPQTREAFAAFFERRSADFGRPQERADKERRTAQAVRRRRFLGVNVGP